MPSALTLCPTSHSTPVQKPVAKAGGSTEELFVELSKKRRATVRVFNNKPLIDLREFYGDEGDLKPGKKGIALSLEQVRNPLGSVTLISECLYSGTLLRKRWLKLMGF